MIKILFKWFYSRNQEERDCQWLGIKANVIDETGLLYVHCKYIDSTIDTLLIK